MSVPKLILSTEELKRLHWSLTQLEFHLFFTRKGDANLPGYIEDIGYVQEIIEDLVQRDKKYLLDSS